MDLYNFKYSLISFEKFNQIYIDHFLYLFFVFSLLLLLFLAQFTIIIIINLLYYPIMLQLFFKAKYPLFFEYSFI